MIGKLRSIFRPGGRIRTFQIANKLVIMDGKSPLRYLDLTDNTLHIHEPTFGKFGVTYTVKQKGQSEVSVVSSSGSLLEDLAEVNYQLRVEHNHSDMKWYAYYAGRDQISLFDDISHYETASDTPLGALEKLQSQMLTTVELK